jgi:hypothetical protein
MQERIITITLTNDLTYVAMTRVSVMISSRCNDPIADRGGVVPLSAVCQKLKTEIESIFTPNSQATFEVWINEEAPPAGAEEDAWGVCIT